MRYVPEISSLLSEIATKIRACAKFSKSPPKVRACANSRRDFRTMDLKFPVGKVSVNRFYSMSMQATSV